MSAFVDECRTRQKCIFPFTVNDDKEGVKWLFYSELVTKAITAKQPAL